MTKYVLHGGFNKEKGFIKDEFFQEMLKDSPNNAKVLLVYFAESDEMRPLRMEQGKNQFEKNKGSKNIEIKIASPDTFIEDCKWADVIFFSGGRTIRLIEALKKYTDLGEVFKNKIVGGDSAGSNFLGQYFYSPSANLVSEGLGIIPIKIIPHYKDEYKDVFRNIAPEIKPLYLREYEYKVFDIDV